MKKLLGLLMILVSGCLIPANPAFSAVEEPLLLATVQQKVTAEFERIDAALKQAADMVATYGLTGDKTQAALAELCNSFEYAADCAVINRRGIMVTVEPAGFKKFEGKYIGNQDHIKRIMKNGKPVLSDVFRAIEGFDAADAEYPVIKDGKIIGSVSLLFKPEKMLGKIIDPMIQGTLLEIFVMEKGGRILYDVDTSQIGLNTFKSKVYRPYKGLVKLGRRVAANPEGKGFYKFKDASTKKSVKKEAFWRSVSLYGTEWRLVAVHVDRGKSGKEVVPSAQNSK